MIFFAYRNETGTFFTRKIVVKVVQIKIYFCDNFFLLKQRHLLAI
jgi:hypothetical protein